MGEKDIMEKTLEGYNDVFADIVNVLLFGGKQIVDPDDLEDQLPRSIYKADGKLREMERDVVKRWKKQNIRIACIGLENQTRTDPYMALRVAGYDGTEYRAQMIRRDELKRKKELTKEDVPYPVITLVLYFGYKRHWKQPKSLYEALKIPPELKPYVNDVKLNLFEIAWLTDEQVRQFRSDFRIVADYFTQMRKSMDYQPSEETVDHIQAVMSLLKVMDRDHRFEEKLNDADEKEEPKTMSEWLTRVINTSEARGEERGEARGEARGEDDLSEALDDLFEQGRDAEARRALKDKQFRGQILEAFRAKRAAATV